MPFSLAMLLPLAFAHFHCLYNCYMIDLLVLLWHSHTRKSKLLYIVISCHQWDCSLLSNDSRVQCSQLGGADN